MSQEQEVAMQDQICCPQFDPTLWHDKTIEWKEKRFIKGKAVTLLFMPLNFGSTMRRLMGQIEGAGASVPDWLTLSDHTSRWNMDVYVAVDREIPGAENATLSGRFFSKVYEGPFKDTAAWCKDFEAVVAEKDVAIQKQYMWYTTCPKCAKKYGKNYVVIVGEIR
jgi:hypothetical protein